MRKLRLTGLLLAILILVIGCSSNKKDTETKPVETPNQEVNEANKEPVEETKPEESQPEVQEQAPTEATQEQAPGQETPSETSQAPSDESGISLHQVLDTFYTTFDDSEIKIKEIKYDSFFYEIEGYKGNTGYEIKMLASTGSVVEQDIKEEGSSDKFIPIDFGAIITPQEAMEKAKSHSGIDQVYEWHLDTEDNRLVYEIELLGGREVELDATSGEIIELD